MRNMQDYFLTMLYICRKHLFNYLHVNINWDFSSFLYIKISQFLGPGSIESSSAVDGGLCLLQQGPGRVLLTILLRIDYSNSC